MFHEIVWKKYFTVYPRLKRSTKLSGDLAWEIHIFLFHWMYETTQVKILGWFLRTLGFEVLIRFNHVSCVLYQQWGFIYIQDGSIIFLNKEVEKGKGNWIWELGRGISKKSIKLSGDLTWEINIFLFHWMYETTQVKILEWFLHALGFEVLIRFNHVSCVLYQKGGYIYIYIYTGP